MPNTQRTFRVFISSTFEDLRNERDALQYWAFPELSAICESVGARFQPIDLRWGVRDEAALNQKTMEICLSEIDRCQRTGIRPNFIILLGERYGWRPLPARIDAEEFEELRRQIDPADRSLVEGWYERDDNAVPPEFLLKARSGLWTDSERWGELEGRLHSALRQAAQRAGLAPERRFRYEASATHQEIHQGQGRSAEDARHVFAFCRQSRGSEDSDLTRLKSELRERLGTNFNEFPAGDERQLCRLVVEQLGSAIKAQATQFAARSELEAEIEAQDAFAEKCRRFFTGRRESLRGIGDHIRGDDRRPLLVLGESGSGKSALLAFASEAARESDTRRIVIRRFIGATPRSSDGVSLIRSLCTQLAADDPSRSEIPSTFNELVSAFRERLRAVALERPVSIFIDGLNQLRQSDPVATHPWLPNELPPNCAIVLSATELPKHFEQAKLLRLEPFAPGEAEELLSAWLADAHRTLQPEQRRKVLDSFRLSPLPIYLKLLFEEARQWRSSDRDQNCLIGEGVDGVIDRMIDRLSADDNHGQVFVSHTLRYLCAARRGMPEDELLNLLSQDDGVWTDFRSRAHHEPPQRRLPIVIWSRLLFDLQPYLTVLSDPEGEMLALYHGKIYDRISKRFLSNGSGTDTHRVLAKHFRGIADLGGDGEWKESSPRALRELPYHTAASGDAASVVNLLTSLPYLSARVSIGQAYQIAEDYALVKGSREFQEWRDFLQLHAQRLTDHPQMLVALVQLEGFPSARQQVPSRKWRHTWLRSWQEPAPPAHPAPPGFRLEILAERRFPYGRVGAVAWKAGLVFLVEGLGRIGIVEFQNMQELLTTLSIGTGRAVKLACSPDASSLLVVMENGNAKLYRCKFGAEGRPIASEQVGQLDCLLPEIDDPVVEWQDGAYWLQIRQGLLARIDPMTCEVREEPICGSAPGELGALMFFNDGRIVAALRQGHSTILGTNSGGSTRRVASDLCTASANGGRMAAFFADGHVGVFDSNADPVENAETHAGMVRGAAGWNGDRLLWLKESKDFAKLHTWRPGELESRLVEGGQKLFPAGLHVIPQLWGDDGERSTLVLTSHSVARFHITEGGSMRAGRLEWLFGGATWRAVRREDQKQWLWDGAGKREICLGTDLPGRIYCSLDGRGYFYAARVDRPGTVWNLATLDTSPLRYRPMMLNMAVGDLDNGCWFCDREGGIYYAGDDRELRLAAKVQDGIGGFLHICGEYLLWRGIIPHFFPGSGVDQARAFVFFLRRTGKQAPLERVGERLFAVKEGLCLALDYDPMRKRLVLLWQPERKPPVLRTATVKDFLADRFTDCELRGTGLLGDSRISISPDARVLGIVNSSHELICVSLDSGEVVAVLGGSLPFSDIAPGGSGSSFWLAQAQDVVFGCTLVEPS